MIYTLTGITKRSTFIYWHICCTFPDGRIRYVEMRRERTDKNKLYLKCCHKTKCTARISIMIKDPLQTKKGSRYYDFTPEATEEMILKPENYDTVFHRHKHRFRFTI